MEALYFAEHCSYNGTAGRPLVADGFGGIGCLCLVKHGCRVGFEGGPKRDKYGSLKSSRHSYPEDLSAISRLERNH